MGKYNSEQWSRDRLFASEEMRHVREALTNAADSRFQFTGKMDIMQPIRETPFSAFFDKSEGSMENMKLNPHLAAFWHDQYNVHLGEYADGKGFKETVSVPNTLATLKIFDMVIEGAEPWSDWKQYSNVIPMDAPKVNVPKTKYTDQVGGQTADSINIFREAGGKPPIMGGQIETISLDCSGTNNSFRATIQVLRNHVRDNNALAVEYPLKNAGNLWYYLAGKRIIDQMIADTTVNTDTRANLDFASSVHTYLEAIGNVIASKFPGSQRNTADTMFINPLDAYNTVITSSGASGAWPFLSSFYLARQSQDVINHSGLAAAFGLRNVWVTPQISAGTVMVTKHDVAQLVGLRDDLTIENYDLTVGGLYNSDLVMRFDVQEAEENGAYKITSF